VTVADILVILCTLQPCYQHRDLLQVPVPEIPPRTSVEFYRGPDLPGVRVRFVPVVLSV
jgi:hypothetical protein